MADRMATASIVEREALLRRHLPLVRRVARRHLSTVPSADLDDLLSWGTMGLLAALERYDPARATRFSTYAVFRIRGAILDQLRALDWVPRRVREKATAVERAAMLIEARLGRSATESELASALALPLPAYRTLAAEVAPVGVVSLDDAANAGDQCAPLCDEGAGPLATLLRRERLEQVADAISTLPARDQLVLSLYYREELTMKEVGAVLGLTESRVSQLHTRALARLRDRLVDPPLELARTA